MRRRERFYIFDKYWRVEGVKFYGPAWEPVPKMMKRKKSIIPQ
jgi:hypothetical protein